jgi:hypothetical protein
VADLGVCESGDVGCVELLELNGGAPAQGAVASLPIVEEVSCWLAWRTLLPAIASTRRLAIGPARQGVKMGTPVLLLVDEDHTVLEALTGDLGRRFGVDYQLLAEPSPAAALTTLRQLAARSQPVALVLAGQQMAEMPGVEFLVTAHGLHPAAKPVLLVARGDYSAAHPAVRAMTLGQIDYHLLSPGCRLSGGCTRR